MDNFCVQLRSAEGKRHLPILAKWASVWRPICLTFLMYAISSVAEHLFELLLLDHSDRIPVLTPASAVLAAALLLEPTRRWAGILLAAASAHFMAYGGSGTAWSLVVIQCAHNCLLSVLTAAAVKKALRSEPFAFDTSKQAIAFIVFGAGLAPAIAALFPASLPTFLGLSEPFGNTWRAFALSDALSIGAITPAFLVLYAWLLGYWTAGPSKVDFCLELVGMLLGMAGITALFFMSSGNNQATSTVIWLFLQPPLLLWAAWRLGPAAVSALLTLVAFIAIRRSPLPLTDVQAFLLAVGIPFVYLSVIVRQRSMTMSALRRDASFAREEYSKLAAIYEHLPIGLAFLDTKLTYRRVNKYLAQFHGLSAEAHIGKTLTEVLGPEVAATATQLCRKALAEGDGFEREVNGPMPSTGSERRNWLVSLFPVRNARGLLGLNAIIQDVTERKRSEAELRENQLTIQGGISRIQDLAGRLIQIQEAERTRIARDLHDDISQRLAELSIEISRLKCGVKADSTMSNSLEGLQTRAVELADEVRNISHGLHSSVLQHMGLAAALRSHCREMQNEHRTDFTLSTDEEIEDLSPDVSLCLYRVAQEAISNAIRHGGASHILVQLNRRDDGIALSVKDNGCGFDVAGIADQDGLGLISIEERVRILKGKLTIKSAPATGTSLCAWVSEE